MLKKLLLAASIVALPSLAIAQTFAPNMPILGGASYCASTVNGVCVSTIPAGPAQTGAETIPADTNIGNSGVQAVKVPIASLGGGVQNAAPLTGTTVTFTPGASKLILNPAGTISTLTIALPAATALYDGQLITLVTSQTVTTLTLSAGAGVTIDGTNTTLTAAAPLQFMWSAASGHLLKIIL